MEGDSFAWHALMLRLCHVLAAVVDSRCRRVLADDADTLARGLALLLAGWRGVAAKVELGHEVPALGHLEAGLYGLIDERVVVLEAGADALLGEHGPDVDLRDALGVRGKAVEGVGVGVQLGWA